MKVCMNNTGEQPEYHNIIIMKLDLIIERPVKYVHFYEPEIRGGVSLNFCTSGVISVFNRGK